MKETETERKIKAYYRLTVSHTGAHTPASLNYKKYTIFYTDGSEEEISESVFNAYHKDSGLPVYGGTVTRPFHKFYGMDKWDARKVVFLNTPYS